MFSPHHAPGSVPATALVAVVVIVRVVEAVVP
jgi:hypothetical protein